MKKILVALSGLLFALSSQSFAATEGQDYEVLASPYSVAKRPSEDVVVQVFFAYTCIHCYNMHVQTKEWVESLADNIRYELIPVDFGANFQMHGRALYVGELMKNQEEIHDLVFDEFNANRNVARNNKDMAAILAKAGVPEDKYEAIATSFLVDQKIGYASKLTRAAQVNSTPSVVIDGKYKVSGYAPGITVEILEELIERAIQD